MGKLNPRRCTGAAIGRRDVTMQGQVFERPLLFDSTDALEISQDAFNPHPAGLAILSAAQPFKKFCRIIPERKKHPATQLREKIADSRHVNSPPVFTEPNTRLDNTGELNRITATERIGNQNRNRFTTHPDRPQCERSLRPLPWNVMSPGVHGRNGLRVIALERAGKTTARSLVRGKRFPMTTVLRR